LLQLTFHNNCGQWQSVENYYIRQLLAVDRNVSLKIPRIADYPPIDIYGTFANKTLTREDLELAKEVLAGFDLVVIIERAADDKDMVRMMHALLGNNVRRKDLPVHRSGSEREKYFEPPSEATLERLRELNALDIELYEYAVKLSRHSVENWLQRKKGPPLTPDQKKEMLKKCDKPPFTLPDDHNSVLLGGNGCNEETIFFHGENCTLHSQESGSKHDRYIKPRKKLV